MSLRFKAAAKGKMALDRIKEASSNAADKLKSIKSAEIKDKIAGALPKSGDDVGKHIEQKLAASRTVWRNAGMVLFSRNALENMSLSPRTERGIVMLLFTVLILIFPTERSMFHAGALAKNFLFVLLGLLVAEAIAFGVMRAFGSETRFKTYFSTVNTAVLMSLLLVSIPLAIVTFAIFSITIRSEAAIGMFFTLLPFYNYLIFGWATEDLSRIKGIRGIALALITLLVLLFFNQFIPMMM